MNRKENHHTKKPKTNETSRQRWQRRTKFYAKGNLKEKLKIEKHLQKAQKNIEKEIQLNKNPNSFYDQYFQGKLDHELEDSDNTGFVEIQKESPEQRKVNQLEHAKELRQQKNIQRKKELKEKQLLQQQQLKKAKETKERKKKLLKRSHKGQPLMDNIIQDLLTQIDKHD